MVIVRWRWVRSAATNLLAGGHWDECPVSGRLREQLGKMVVKVEEEVDQLAEEDGPLSGEKLAEEIDKCIKSPSFINWYK